MRHRSMLSPDPQFVGKMPVVIDPYVDPSDNPMVPCADEKRQIHSTNPLDRRL